MSLRDLLLSERRQEGSGSEGEEMWRGETEKGEGCNTCGKNKIIISSKCIVGVKPVLSMLSVLLPFCIF